MSVTLSAYVLTYNEERFLPQCLEFLCSVTDDVVVVDSGSTDRTPEIAQSFPHVRFYHRPMPYHFADQRNYAQSLCQGQWILTLDADELFHPDFVRILPALLEDDRYLAYSFPRLALIGDEDHYIDKPAIAPGDWDTQVRLHRKALQWAHEGRDGLHPALMINGRPADSHPAHVPPEVRYVHYPVLHYQLLKCDEELRAKASVFLSRQDPEHRIVITDEDWWVRAKRQQYPVRRISDWVCWLSFPPQNDEERIAWLYNFERRVDELIEYTGLTRRTVEQRIATAAQEGHEAFLRVDVNDEQAIIQFYKEWDGYIFELTGWHVRDPDCRRHVQAAIQAVQGCRNVLVHGDGIGDLSLELTWRGIPKVTYAELDCPSRRFFEWRRRRFGLENRIQIRTLTGEPGPEEVIDMDHAH